MNTNAVSLIENNCVAEKTKDRYNSGAYQFIIWLYKSQDTAPDLLRPRLLVQIGELEERADLTESKKKKAIRELIVTGWLKKMDRKDPQRCPVDVSILTYDIAALYMSQKKDGDGNYFSKSHYCGARSCIINLFTMSNVSPPPGFRERMQTLMKGFKRTIVSQKVERGETLEEGKEVMSFACYELLCKKFFEGEKDEYNFAHLFLTLEWNLIARSDNVVNLAIGDLEWNDDALICYLKRTKTDQEGNNGKTPYHLYSNPLSPHLSVVLALGNYLLTNPGVIKENGMLFRAQYQYNRYSNVLQRVVKENEAEFARIGVKVGSIGTHSARKGAASLAASGCTIAPAMASICNRAGWKMGGTRDKYIRYENAGDQFLGRTLTGINSLSKEFSVSPPFFHLPQQEIEGVDELIRTHIVGASECSAKLFEVIRMSFASVVYHRDHMHTHLHKKNRLRSHPLFNNLPEVCVCVLSFDILNKQCCKRSFCCGDVCLISNMLVKKINDSIVVYCFFVFLSAYSCSSHTLLLIFISYKLLHRY